ncbi:hypothetical protein GOQ27_05040 [Clostridium sp. D2Q-11]|uniref:YceG-like family protein n=1 Tax=Anaeromonas frigoriresistens TaxID=2683708 RepID=A0A942Z8D5_9FIRM|nr:hypothetical protein [Anaeromonas frigoriresistens]MBS4537815.1 hypothetical protein [Anaeromonas frigoriresistens]
MNNAFEKVKDLLYDYIDYFLILLVVLLIGAIIGWRLDILFGDNELEETDNNIQIEESNDENVEDSTKEEQEKNSDEDAENDERDDQEKDNSGREESSSVNNQDGQAKEEISLDIPEGSLPPNTAQILLDNGVIQDKNQFLSRASELGLDIKLRSGSYTFIKNSDLDTIIKILANIK